MTQGTETRRTGRLIAGTPEARRVSALGGQAFAEAARRRRTDAMINDLIGARHELSEQQLATIARAFSFVPAMIARENRGK